MAIFRNKISEIDKDFISEVREGLTAESKYLSSKYFYDEIGDDIFIEIMKMPEYYLTDSEFEILSEQTSDIIDSLGIKGEYCELIELGAGDGTKTIELLKNINWGIKYIPIDISTNALNSLEEKLKLKLPELEVEGKQGKYFEVLNDLGNPQVKQIILFLGSNIGNMTRENAAQFISQLSSQMKSEDKILLGVDLKKDPNIILPAYNDAEGITARFNLNVLRRINRELGANFDLDQFKHEPVYDQVNGMAKSYLKSLVKQEVFIEVINKTIYFDENELIHTEISVKYSRDDLNKLIDGSGLSVAKIFQDKKEYFADVVLIKN